ncbi:MAG: hypothetical protein KN64_00730 [Sulfurovum sp. AS07-7]|nr:MAG: hypothetical protein KN64_00730 [Sulfurovum sp. AS07-7]
MKKSRLEAFIEKNLPKVLKEESIASLGDRKQYVGSSDIGSCLRKSYLDKVRDTEYDIATLIRFERGHISEGIVRKMLTGLKVQEQVEVKGTVHGFGLKSHIDFMLEDKNECVVVEAKSVSSSITEPYTSWVLQVQYQLHLLSINRKKPVRAHIIAIDINSGWFKTFEVAYNETLAQMALRRATQLITAIKENKEPQAEEQLYCSMCPHKADCPLMNAGAVEVQGDIQQLAREIADLNKQKKQLEKMLDAKKVEMEEFMKTAKIEKIRVEDNFISLANDFSYSSIDTKELKQKEPELYEMLIGKYGKTIARKGYIQIK